jgi:hypothetical protein
MGAVYPARSERTSHVLEPVKMNQNNSLDNDLSL